MNPDPILLLAHGTPDILGEMAEYLSKVTGGRTLPDEVVKELQHRYAVIGLCDEPLPDGPPLTRWTLLQGRLLSEALEVFILERAAKHVPRHQLTRAEIHVLRYCFSLYFHSSAPLRHT